MISIKDSIVAGEILSFLEQTKRVSTFKELRSQLNETDKSLRGGIKRLVNDGLVSVDEEKLFIRT